MSNRNGKIVSFISQTGNVMKSTISQALAVKLTQMEVLTTLCCLDREHRSVNEFFKARENHNRNSSYKRTMFWMYNALNAKHALDNFNDEQVYIIDMPSRAGQATIDIASKSDLIVMPTCTGLKDLNLTVKTFYELINAEIDCKKIMIMITRYSTEREVNESYDFLKSVYDNGDKYRFILNRFPLSEKVSYRDAIDDGLTIFETSAVSLNKQSKKSIEEIIKFIGVK